MLPELEEAFLEGRAGREGQQMRRKERENSASSIRRRNERKHLMGAQEDQFKTPGDGDGSSGGGGGEGNLHS